MTSTLLARYGYTQNCPGCRYAQKPGSQSGMTVCRWATSAALKRKWATNRTTSLSPANSVYGPPNGARLKGRAGRPRLTRKEDVYTVLHVLAASFTKALVSDPTRLAERWRATLIPDMHQLMQM